MKVSKSILLAAALLAASTLNHAFVVGSGTGGNCVPFGCDFNNSGTRYQQVYDSSQFSGTTTINSLSFYSFLLAGGNLNTGTFTIHLSTTNKAVDGLDTIDFNANIGPNDALFTVSALSGAAPSELVFSGSPFTYIPTGGNLLIDIFSNISAGGSSAFQANGGDANGVYSRAQNFGGGFSGFGLVTGFNEVEQAVPEPSSVALLGLGLLGVAAARKRKSLK